MNRKDEIRNELEQISPYLAGLDLRPAFKIPKGYFDELPDTVLESVSPLAELKKEQVFKVPENYFKSLPDLVLAKVAPQEEEEVVTKPVLSPQSSWIDDLINSVAVLFQPRYALRLAAVAIVLIGGFVFLQKGMNDAGALMASNDADPLEEYGISLDDLTDDDLELLLSDASSSVEGDELETDDQLLDVLLEGLDEISDEDLEGLL